MEGKKHCKWYNDEFCTNGDSPCVADYCPVVEYPELCKCREVEVSEYPDIVFSCKKCGHLLFFSMADKTVEELAQRLEMDCPSCGEESCENWQYVRVGNYQEEYGLEE